MSIDNLTRAQIPVASASIDSERLDDLATTQDQKTGEALRIYQTVARDLGIAILSGELQPGDNLGGEIESSERLGVSRTAYREAVRILVAKGLVESRPRAGTHVTPTRRWYLLDHDILAWMFSTGPNDEFINDLFELRFVIEPAAAYLCAVRRSEHQLKELKQAVTEVKEFSLATPQGRAADRRFHDHIIEASGNLALGTLAGSIGTAIEWTTHFKAMRQNQKTPHSSIDDHLPVLRAIEHRDANGASEAMRTLIRNASQDMADIIKLRTMD
jgi:DNA-binding FadR family transcriptional regulator